ncbi:MAG: thioredoxin family protein [Verrucomicrobiota bacterium]
MKVITWLASFAVGAMSLAVFACAAPVEGWTDDLDKALVTAKAEKKFVLVEFTGSDWCPGCKFMSKNVFTKKEFIKAASKKFILVELDFPNGDKALAEKNKPMYDKYKVEGYPTVVLLDADGKEFAHFDATKFPDPDAFLKHLDEALEKKDLD